VLNKEKATRKNVDDVTVLSNLCTVDCQEPSDDLTSDQSLSSREALMTVDKTHCSLTMAPRPKHISRDANEDDEDEDDDDDDSAAESAEMKCTVRVTGMTCGSCVANIERHVRKLKGECSVVKFWFLYCFVVESSLL